MLSYNPSQPLRCTGNLKSCINLYVLWYPPTHLHSQAKQRVCAISIIQISFIKCHFMYQFSYSVVSDSLKPHGLQYSRPPCPSPTPEVHPNPYPLSQWCQPTILSPVVPFSSCPQSFPVSGSYPMSQFFVSGGRSIAVSASTLAFPKKIQNWSALGWTGWISLQSKGLSRVFSSTTVPKHQFFSTQLSSQSKSL